MDHHQMLAGAIESTVDIALTESRDDFDSQIDAVKGLLGTTGTMTVNADQMVTIIQVLKSKVLNHIEAIPSEADAAYESLKQDR